MSATRVGGMKRRQMESIQGKSPTVSIQGTQTLEDLRRESYWVWSVTAEPRRTNKGSTIKHNRV